MTKLIKPIFLSGLCCLACLSGLIAQPTITSMTIYNGNIGAAIGIAGTGFNTLASKNIVYFGATQAVVTSSTSTNLNVIVPAGATYLPVTELNSTTTKMCFATRSFMPSFNSTNYVAGAVHFDPTVDFATTGSNAYGIVIADLDGDGKPDMIVSNNVSNTISIFRNISTTGTISSGSFGAPQVFVTGANPSYLKVADLNSDGLPDIIVANSGSGTVSVFTNTSTPGIINDGSFAAKVDFAVGNNPFDIAVADFDGDGKPDIAVTNSIGTANTISVLQNISTPGLIRSSSFAAAVTFVTGSIPVKIVAADFDGDGKPDIAVTNNSSNTISVFRNTATSGSITSGSFALKVDFVAGTNPRGIFAADMDNDGKYDLVVTNRTSNTISVFRNTATSGSISAASFQAAVSITTGNAPYDVAMGDLDGNGKPDIIVTNFGANTVSIFRNIGSTGSINSSTFTAKLDMATGGTGGPYGVAVGDLDGDGKPEIITANANSGGSVSVLHNNMLTHISNRGLVCLGTTRLLGDSVTGGVWTSSATSIATVSASGLVTGIAAGMAIITYSVTGGFDTAQITVTAKPTIAGITVSPAAACVDSALTLTAGATTGFGSLTSYIWTGPNNYFSTGVSPSVVLIPTTTAANGFYSVIVTFSGNFTSNPAVTSSAITLNSAPVVGTITGATSICVASSTTLSIATSGGTWSSSNTALATINSSGLVSGVGSGVVNISYTVANACGSVSAIIALTINPVPTITATTPNARCNAGSLLLQATASTGTIHWYSSATGGTAIATGGTFTTPIISSTTTYYVDVTNSFGCISSTRTAIVASINPAPSLTSASNNGPVCIGSTVLLFANGSLNVTAYLWTGPDVITNSSSASASIANAVTPGSDIYTVTVSNGIGTGCTTYYTTVVIINTQQAWLTTATSTNWNSAANWACGRVPIATDTVIIPSGAANPPHLYTSSTGSVFNISLAVGASLFISDSAALNIAGILNNSGVISGNGVVMLNGTSPQTIKGNGTLNNIEILNPSGVAINTAGDTLTVTGTLTLASGNLNTNNRLILSLSDNQSLQPVNGRIGTITGGSITGRIIDQQFISGGKRAYRFWGTPFTDSIPLSQLEKCIDITGMLGSIRGFTTTTTNSPSAFWYHTNVSNSGVTKGTANPGWQPFTWCTATPGLLPAADTNLIQRFEGLRLYIRGAKGQGLDDKPYIPSPVTIRQSGHVNTGDFDMPLQKGFAKIGSQWIQDNNQKSNPYPSSIDIGAVIHAAWVDSMLAESKFYVWYPFGGTAGVFITINESIYTPYYLPANTSFQVRARFGHDSSKLHFTESLKTGSETNQALLRNAPSGMSLNIYDTAYHLWDMLKINFNESATDEKDASFDGTKPMNDSVNFYSWSSDHLPLSWDERPYRVGKVILLGFLSTIRKEFIIKVDGYDVPYGGKLYLLDKYKNEYLSLVNGGEYRFYVTQDPASQGDGRFEIGIDSTETQFSVNQNINVSVFPNPATNMLNVVYNTYGFDPKRIRILDLNGKQIMDQYLGVQQFGDAALSVEKLPAGIYMLEFTSGNNILIKKFMKN